MVVFIFCRPVCDLEATGPLSTRLSDFKGRQHSIFEGFEISQTRPVKIIRGNGLFWTESTGKVLLWYLGITLKTGVHLNSSVGGLYPRGILGFRGMVQSRSLSLESFLSFLHCGLQHNTLIVFGCYLSVRHFSTSTHDIVGVLKKEG